MGRIVMAVLILLGVVVAVGIGLSVIFRARHEEEFRRCQNNLRELGTFGLLHATAPDQAILPEANDYFPSGTLVNPNLRPEQRRMSWYALVLAPIDQGPAGLVTKQQQIAGLLKEIDVAKPWDAEVHQRLAHTRLNVAICPAQWPAAGENEPAPANYLGNGGLGRDTASLTLEQAGKKAGTFRYDTRTALETIRAGDGLSNSISLVETARDLGPWLRGGPSTIRSLDPDEPPYLGPGRLYSGCHQGRGNFAIADGSVRVISDQVNPAVFRALLTINGGAKEADFDMDN